MKNKKRIIPIIAVAAMLAILLASSSVVSYLVDKDQATNPINIGNVALAIQESNFPIEESNRIMVPGTKIAKDPVVENTGSLPEYVFLAVTVPKKNVELLYEKQDVLPNDKNEGEKKYTDGPKYVEIFRTFATNTTGTPTKISDYTGIDYTYIDDEYNKFTTDGSTEGWVYIKTTVYENYNVHYFGYNKILAGKTDNNTSGETTIPLFDHIQLKSFIEGQITDSSLTVDVKAFGIQSDNIPDVTPNNTTKIISKEDVGKVFAIIEKKMAGGDYQ